MISLRLFGGLRVAGPSGDIPISGAKTQGLLAYLALNTEMPPTRDRLMALFWGDRFTEQARQCLRQAIAKLRRTFAGEGGEAIASDADRVGLNLEIIEVDIDAFFRLADDPSPDAAIRAVELMTGPLLDGLYGQQSDFEDWIASERQRVSTTALKVFERAVEARRRYGDTDAALATARRLVEIDPLRDASQMVLMRLLAQSGERAAALQHFHAYEAHLKQELDTAPGGELRRLIDEIRGEKFMAPMELEGARPIDARPAEAPGADAGRLRICVVPFGTVASCAGGEGFVEELSQDITTHLSRYRWLDVVASPQIAGPRLTARDLAELGTSLGLDYAVHGALRAQERRMRLTVQLAEPRTGRYVWVSRYERECDVLEDLLDELAETIAASVEAEVERLAGRAARCLSFEEMGAWDCYHRGLAIQYEFNAETNAEAQRHFRRAVALDPHFAAAYARLSYALVIAAIYFEADNVPEVLHEALELARRSCLLDPDDAVGRFALGRVYLARGEYERSLAELNTAVELNPSMAQAHCGLGDSLAYSGELEVALPRFEEAVRLSPSDPYRWAFLSYGATALLFMGRYEEAAEWAARAEAVPNSHYWATAIRASALGHLGKTEQAERARAELEARRPGITCDFVRERLFYLRDPAQIDTYVKGLEAAGLP